MRWESHDEREAAEVARCELAFDIDVCRDHTRALLAIVERLSIVADHGRITSAQAAAIVQEVESATHLLDNGLRLLVPRVAEALHLDVRPWV